MNIGFLIGGSVALFLIWKKPEWSFIKFLFVSQLISIPIVLVYDILTSCYEKL